MVRAKFFVKSMNHVHVGGDNIYVDLVLGAVYDDKLAKENASFAKATPSGELKIAITNPYAVAQFELGKSYYMDITPADEAAKS